MAISTRLPWRWPVSPLLKPGTTWSSGKAMDWPRLKESSNRLPVRPSTP